MFSIALESSLKETKGKIKKKEKSTNKKITFFFLLLL